MKDLNKSYLKNRSVDFQKISKFGFEKVGNKFIYKKGIQNGDFSVLIEIDKSKVISKVMDNFDGSEYALVDIEDSSGKFVASIKEQYEDLLTDFIQKCTVLDTFKESSSKSVIKYVNKKYGDNLEFLWEDYDGAVFRNQDNLKWYGLIMKVKEQSFVNSTLKRMKLANKKSKNSLLNKKDFSDEKLIEIIDIHIDKTISSDLIDYNTIFPGFHMNKDSWITVILDDETNLKKVYDLIDNSYKMTVKSGSYVAPSNISMFDVRSYVEKNKTFVWHKQPKDVKKGDLVYIYLGAPYSQIMYKCVVTKTNLQIYSNRDMELKLLKKYKNNEFPYSFLKQNGLGFIRAPRSIPEKLANILKES